MKKQPLVKTLTDQDLLKYFSENILQSSNVMIVCLDVNGYVTFVNKKTEQVTGYRKSEILGKDWYELIVPRKQYPEAWSVFAAFKKQGKSIIGEYENPIRTKKGEERIIQWRNSDLQEDGHTIGTISYGIDITISKRAIEHAVKLASFPELNPSPVIEFDVTGNVHYANPATRRLFPTLTSQGFRHPFLAGIEALVIEKKAHKDKVVSREVTVGKQAFQQILTTIPETTTLRLYSTDISKLKQVENAICENRAELEEAQRIGHIGSWSWNAITDKITWSKEYYRMIGLDLSKTPPGYEEHLKVYTDESAKRLDAAVKNVMKTGAPYALDLEQLRPDGTRGWIIARAEAVRNQKGKIVGLRGTAQDITERKLAELEISRINRALRIVSEINQALIRTTDETQLLHEACRIAVEVGGYRLAWVGFAEHDTKKSIRAAAYAGTNAGYIETASIVWADTKLGNGPTGKAIRTGQTIVVDDISKDPSMIPWRKEALARGYRSSIAIPLKNDGQAFGAFNLYSQETCAFQNQEKVILQELADDMAFGISTLRLRKEVEERTHEVDQMKSKFIHIVSHQLRTPLNVIRWNLETLLEGKRGEIASTQEEIIRGTYAADIEVVSRIDDLMTAMDIEEGRIRLDLSTVDTDDVMTSTLNQTLQAASPKQIRHTIVSTPKRLPTMQADATKVRDVLSRLVDNAITYTKNKGEITIAISAKGGKVRFEITDTGIGIPSSEQSHIFERFYRGSNASVMKPDASGLSLFICKHYIQAHQGTIGFTSQEKKGSTFWFELPVSGPIVT